MAKNIFLKNISANTLQLVVNQVFGLAIFYALSKGLDKNVFGQINWTLAVLLTIFAILTFGIDQVMVRKIAAGYDRQSLFTTYLVHVILTGGIFYLAMLVFIYFFPVFTWRCQFLMIIGAGKLMIFFTTAFKQVATGLEKFSALLFMSVVSNIIRGTALWMLLISGNMSMLNVFLVFIAGDATELLVCVLIARPIVKVPYKLKWNGALHLSLLKEALPQTGVVIFSAVMARFDWILIGFLVSDISLAEYSFAWKIFEISTLPLLIIAPVLIPLFTRTFKTQKQKYPYFLLEWQIIIACMVALWLNLSWAPVIDYITDGRYGEVNIHTAFILSLSMPMLYFSNYLWTINFAEGRLRRIFYIMLGSFIVNILSCSLLIPIYKNEGAAIANLVTALAQLICYLKTTNFNLSRSQKIKLLLWPGAAILSYLMAKYLIDNRMWEFLGSTLIYVLVIYFSRSVRKKDWQSLALL